MPDSDRCLTDAVISSALKQRTDSKECDLREILLHFLEVLDSLDRLIKIAAKSPPQSEGMGWLAHLRALRTQLIEAFLCAGVTFFDSVDKPFDPERQEAVEVIQRHDVDDYTVIEEINRGCEWQREVLRFARVVVARNQA